MGMAPYDTFVHSWGYRYNRCDLRKDPGAVLRMLEALDLARLSWSIHAESALPGGNNPEDLTIPYWAGDFLRAIYDDHDEDLFSAEVPQLRRAIRSAIDSMPSVRWDTNSSELWKHIYALAIVNHSSLWEESYAAAQQRIEKVLLTMNVDDRPDLPNPLWSKLEDMLKWWGNAFSADDDLPVHERPPRYEHVSLFYPRKTSDEDECLRRSREILAKLSASPDPHRQSFAYNLKKRLSWFSGEEPQPVAGGLNPADFLVDRDHVQAGVKEPSSDAWDDATPHERAEFIQGLLARRKPDQYLNSLLLSRLSTFSPTSFPFPTDIAPEDAARLVDSLDGYRSQIETEFLQEAAPNSKKVEYLETLAGALEMLGTYYSTGAAALNRHHPERPMPTNAFPVSHYRFCKDWMGMLVNQRMTESQSDGVNLFVLEGNENFPQHFSAQSAPGSFPPEWHPKRIFGDGNKHASSKGFLF